VVVVGCSGSGKTTLAKALAAALGVPHVELDSIFHQPGWTPLGKEDFRRRVDEVTEADGWVVDGNYSAAKEIAWRKADTVVWLDLPYVTVLSRTIWRTLRRTITREELWNGNREPLSNLWLLKPEKSIIAWAATRHGVYRRRYSEAERDPRWARLCFVRLRSQAEADEFIAGVASTTTQADAADVAARADKEE
jgi:adenylate kinase family enzyme